MLSVDTNILCHAYNVGAPEHESALEFLSAHLENQNFAVSDYVLVELYNLLRNRAIMPSPLPPGDAVDLIMELRANPYWTILPTTQDVSTKVWAVARQPQFPRRAIFDARLAHSLAAEGVKMFATRNVTDFQRFGLFDVFDPIV